MLIQSDSVTAHRSESVVCQAGGFQRNLGISVDRYGEEKGLNAKVVTNVYFYDYTGWEVKTETMEQEETYINRKYTVTVDDGVPTSQLGVDYTVIEDYCIDQMLTHIPDPVYWQEAVVTDLGSLYLVEFTYNEDFGNTVQNTICSDFFQDPSLLNSLASAYVTNESTGYAAYDKYTGFPTSAGYYYEGTHTIEGGDYVLTKQSDLSIDGLSLSSYKEITDEMLPEDKPETAPTPLFYHVTGENGQEMWLFGTIHVGDNRTAYLPQEIFDALASSAALAVECDTEGFDKQCEEDEALQDQVSDLYYYSDGTTIQDHLEPELYETALKYMKATGNYNMNALVMKPSIWSNSIENFYLKMGYRLRSDYGMDNLLMERAREQEKPIVDVESGIEQMQMLGGYSDALQEYLLCSTLSTAALEYQTEVQELFELWCSGDEAKMIAYLNEEDEEPDTSTMTQEELDEYNRVQELMDEYNSAMSSDRNVEMLKAAIDYLESDKVVFYAVGLAHLLAEDGLVNTLRDAGYTVELVTYS
jgi:uncharacterized protein YbaP (TraB family)